MDLAGRRRCLQTESDVVTNVLRNAGPEKQAELIKVLHDELHDELLDRNLLSTEQICKECNSCDVAAQIPFHISQMFGVNIEQIVCVC